MGKKRQKITTVGFVALGCPKNIVDAERMLAEIGKAGFVISPDVDNADVVVINTCGFIAPAKEEALEAIAQAVAQKEKGSVRKVIVAGCLSQRMGESLGEIGGIDAIVGLSDRDNIAKIIRRTLKGSSRDGMEVYLNDVGSSVADDRGRLLITPSHWAYLRISEGCDRRCSFCTIPAIRGRFRSKPEEMVLAEAAELVANGAVELSIIAQDSNYYGRDLGTKNALCGLLKKLEQIDRLDWIRLMYLYPAGVDDELIETIAQSQRIVNYVDVPIQHINNDILKSMRRSDRKETTMELVEKLRAAMGDVVLRTTVIAGFPGETDGQFAELLEFIKWARFDALGCFPFFAEEGTPAAELPDQIPEDVRHERTEAIMLAQQEIAFEKIDALAGKDLTCLVDEVGDGGAAVGRYYGQAPHIDSVCHIEGCTVKAGEFVKVKVTGGADYDLLCEASLCDG